MRGTTCGRALLIFPLIFAVGEFVAYSLTPKWFFGERPGVQQVGFDWAAFLWLSVADLVIACGCAYRTWQGRTRQGGA